MIKLSKEDKFFTIKEPAIDIEKAQALDSLKELDKKVKDKKRKELYHYLDRQEEAYKDKIKTFNWLWWRCQLCKKISSKKKTQKSI